MASGSYALAADFEAIDATIIKELGIGLIVVGLFSMLLSIVSVVPLGGLGYTRAHTRPFP